jgi:hypothetical protein
VLVIPAVLQPEVSNVAQLIADPLAFRFEFFDIHEKFLLRWFAYNVSLLKMDFKIGRKKRKLFLAG